MRLSTRIKALIGTIIGLLLLTSPAFTQPITLYGMTYNGGPNNGGSLYRVNSNGSFFENVGSLFNGGNGWNPHGGVIRGQDGLIYGMTLRGGPGSGTIFRYNPMSNTYELLYAFVDLNKGYEPNGDLMQVPNGMMYGVASKGGDHDEGVLFSLNPETKEYTKLFDFGNGNGRNPLGNLTPTASGALLGVASDGIIFSFDPATHSFQVLGNNNGLGAYYGSQLVQAKNGKYYGLSVGGDPAPVGALYSFNPVDNSVVIEYGFSGAEGYNPYGNLTLLPDGRFAGLTWDGGGGGGVLFTFDPATRNYVKEYVFPAGDGSYPNGRNLNGTLLLASDGKLYGVAKGGGANNDGTVYSYDLNTRSLTKLADMKNEGVASGPLSGTLLEYNSCASLPSSEQLTGSIPDAFPVKEGGAANTIYLGYGPQSVDLLPQVLPENNQYTYRWNTGSTSSTLNVSPNKPGTYSYTLEVTSPKGCKVIATKQVVVIDVRCGSQGERVQVCRGGKALCIAPSAVQVQLRNGATLGACAPLGESASQPSRNPEAKETNTFKASIFPNPSSGSFNINMGPLSGLGPVSLRILDASGRTAEQYSNLAGKSMVTVGAALKPGIYMVEIRRAGQVQHLTLIKQ